MYVSAQRVAFEPRRSIAFGSISGTYAAVGTPFSNSIRMLKVENETDVSIDISYDGSTDHDRVAASSAFIYDFVSNTPTERGTWEFPKGLQIYVKGAPTSGSVYVIVMYAPHPGA